ncbi:MAG: PfkB family carbohydrate kinase [Thermosphaera sp.]
MEEAWRRKLRRYENEWVRRRLTERFCLYGNPTLDLINDQLGRRWQYGGGVFYSSLPLLMRGFEVEIYSIVSHPIIDHPVYKYVKPLQYSSDYNIFYLMYDSRGSRYFKVIRTAPQLYDHCIHEEDCIAIVNPVLQEISVNLVKRLAVKSSILAGDIQGFIRMKQGDSIVLKPGPLLIEVLKEIEILHMDVDEARALINNFSFNEIIEKLTKFSRGKALVITNGPGDVTIISDGKVLKIPHKGKVVKDATGAGDFFLGTLVAYFTKLNNVTESAYKSIEETEVWLEKRLHRHPLPG